MTNPRKNGTNDAGSPRAILEEESEEVDVVRAEGNYVRIHSSDRSYLVRKTMAGLQRKLDARQYVRIHRSVIVRAGCVREVATTSDREYEVKLLDGGCFRVGRNSRCHLKVF